MSLLRSSQSGGDSTAGCTGGYSHIALSELFNGPGSTPPESCDEKNLLHCDFASGKSDCSSEPCTRIILILKLIFPEFASEKDVYRD